MNTMIEEYIVTVTGEIPANQLGETTAHECRGLRYFILTSRLIILESPGLFS